MSIKVKFQSQSSADCCLLLDGLQMFWNSLIGYDYEISLRWQSKKIAFKNGNFVGAFANILVIQHPTIYGRSLCMHSIGSYVQKSLHQLRW